VVVLASLLYIVHPVVDHPNIVISLSELCSIHCLLHLIASRERFRRSFHIDFYTLFESFKCFAQVLAELEVKEAHVKISLDVPWIDLNCPLVQIK